jgi:phosphohistidine phosphatase
MSSINRSKDVLMKILLVRHAPAEDPDSFIEAGGIDADRPLTQKGRRKMKRSVRGLRKVLPRCSMILTSPLIRARQTAVLLAESLSIPVIEVDALAPAAGAMEALKWLSRLQASQKKASKKKGVIIVVGHEPQLGRLLGALLTGTPRSVLKLKKCSATLVACNLGRIKSGELLWSITGKQLRQLAKVTPGSVDRALRLAA